MAEPSRPESGVPVDPNDEPEIMTTTEVCLRYWLDRRVLYRIEELGWFARPVQRTAKGQPGNGHKEHLYDRRQRETIRMVVRLQRMGLSETSIGQVLSLAAGNERPTVETILKTLATDELDNAWRVELRAFLIAQLARSLAVKLGPTAPLLRTKGPAARQSGLEQQAARTMRSDTKVRTSRDAPKRRQARKH